MKIVKVLILTLSMWILFGFTYPEQEQRFLVTFKPDAFGAKSTLASYSLKEITNNKLGIAIGKLTLKKVLALRKNAAVERIEPDLPRWQLSYIPSDPYYPADPGQNPIGQYNWSKINANAALDINKGSGAIVAVIDSGIDKDHPDLATQITQPFNTINPGSYPFDDYAPIYHGTAVTGIIGALADNSEGISGLAPEAQIMPIKVFNSAGNAYDSDIVEAVVYATDNGADVINMSFVSPTYPEAVHDAIRYAFTNNVILVGAAGNGATDTPYYPASFPEVISVGATERESDEKAAFSNFGPKITVVAPGREITSTIGDNFTKYSAALNGTSFSAPQVAAAAALLKTQYPQLTPGQIKYILAHTATDLGDPGKDNIYGWGMLNIAEALTSAPDLLNSLPDPDEYEPNDNQAIPINLNKAVYGTFHDIADYDQYSFSVGPNATIKINLQSPVQGNAVFKLYNSNNNLVENSNILGSGEITLTGLPAGTYTAVLNQENYEIMDGQYRFTINCKQTITGQVTLHWLGSLIGKHVTLRQGTVVNDVYLDDQGRFNSPLLPGGIYAVIPPYIPGYLAKTKTIETYGVNANVYLDMYYGDIVVDSDEAINYTDLNKLMEYFGTNPGSIPEKPDLNDDGIVNVQDLAILAVNYGR